MYPTSARPYPPETTTMQADFKLIAAPIDMAVIMLQAEDSGMALQTAVAY